MIESWRVNDRPKRATTNRAKLFSYCNVNALPSHYLYHDTVGRMTTDDDESPIPRGHNNNNDQSSSSSIQCTFCKTHLFALPLSQSLCLWIPNRFQLNLLCNTVYSHRRYYYYFSSSLRLNNHRHRHRSHQLRGEDLRGDEEKLHTQFISYCIAAAAAALWCSQVLLNPKMRIDFSSLSPTRRGGVFPKWISILREQEMRGKCNSEEKFPMKSR